MGVVGSRDFADLDLVRSWVSRLARKHPEAVVVSGGARGVDRTAETEARKRGLHVASFRPYSYDAISDRTEYSIETHTFGERAQDVVAGRRINPPFFSSYRSAAFHRNGWIVDASDHVVAFWDGRSRGTLDTIARAEKEDKLALVLPNEAHVLALLAVVLEAKVSPTNIGKRSAKRR